MAEQPETPTPFTLEESARRLGCFRWIERTMFEALGSEAAGVDDVAVKLFLATTAPHHGWHADLLGDRLPEVRELTPDGQTQPPTTALADLLAATPVVTWYRPLLVRLLDSYAQHLTRCTTVADTNVIRTLELLVEDGRRDLAAAQNVLSDDDASTAAFDAALSEALGTHSGIVAL